MALEKILEIKYATYYHNDELSLLEEHWHNKDAKMTDNRGIKKMN